MTYSLSIQGLFGDWELSGVFLHRQQAIKAALKNYMRADPVRIVIYEINGVGDDRVIYDSKVDSIEYHLSTGKYSIYHGK